MENGKYIKYIKEKAANKKLNTKKEEKEEKKRKVKEKWKTLNAFNETHSMTKERIRGWLNSK